MDKLSLSEKEYLNNFLKILEERINQMKKRMQDLARMIEKYETHEDIPAINFRYEYAELLKNERIFYDLMNQVKLDISRISQNDKIMDTDTTIDKNIMEKTMH
ncbi:MAG: DUF5320 domain-containing protein [Bacilli bacterium]|nr:DUF5320 domain-containing protein [Bacilli bacterium]